MATNKIRYTSWTATCPRCSAQQSSATCLCKNCLKGIYLAAPNHADGYFFRCNHCDDMKPHGLSCTCGALITGKFIKVRAHLGFVDIIRYTIYGLVAIAAIMAARILFVAYQEHEVDPAQKVIHKSVREPK